MSRNQLGLFNEIKEIVFKQDFERGVKICSKCKETLPITKFAILVRKDLKYRRSACKKCSNEAAIVTGKLKLEVGKKPDICDCCNRVVNEIVYNSQGGYEKSFTGAKLDPKKFANPCGLIAASYFNGKFIIYF